MMKHLTHSGIACLLISLVFFLSSAIVSPASATFGKTSASIPIIKVRHPLDNYHSLQKKDVESYLGRKMTFAEKMAFRLNKKKYIGFVRAIEDQTFNAMAFYGFLFSFVIGPLGIIFCIIALQQINSSGQAGRGLARLGLVIGFITTVLILLV